MSVRTSRQGGEREEVTCRGWSIPPIAVVRGHCSAHCRVGHHRRDLFGRPVPRWLRLCRRLLRAAGDRGHLPRPPPRTSPCSRSTPCVGCLTTHCCCCSSTSCTGPSLRQRTVWVTSLAVPGSACRGCCRCLLTSSSWPPCSWMPPPACGSGSF